MQSSTTYGVRRESEREREGRGEGGSQPGRERDTHTESETQRPRDRRWPAACVRNTERQKTPRPTVVLCLTSSMRWVRVILRTSWVQVHTSLCHTRTPPHTPTQRDRATERETYREPTNRERDRDDTQRQPRPLLPRPPGTRASAYSTVPANVPFFHTQTHPQVRMTKPSAGLERQRDGERRRDELEREGEGVWGGGSKTTPGYTMSCVPGEPRAVEYGSRLRIGSLSKKRLK